MITLSSAHRNAGYTLAELCVMIGVVTIVGLLAYSLLVSSTSLLAKNISLNSSNVAVRASLDRIYSDLNQANRLPTLINDDGTPAAGAGPAAGIVFDRYLGGPYIVGNPGTGLPPSTTTLNLFYSTDPLASPPDPAPNDVIVVNGTTRLVTSSSTASNSFTSPSPTPLPNPGRMATVTLQDTLGTYTNPAGTGISWAPGTQQTAYIVHRQAFLVVPVNGISGPAELRMYPDAQGLTNFNDPTKYAVLSHNIGTKTVNGLLEHQPFSVVTQNGASYLNIAMRVEDQHYNKRLATQQANEFNTFLRIDSLFRPKNIP
jgi:type II secretory pathway pseudopilin PulG